MRLALRVKDRFTRHRLPPQTRAGAMAGFTIIEILLVIALMGVIMIVVVPNFNIASSSQESAKVNGIAGDIRAAYDMAVLNRRPYRLAFEFKTGDYWLESTQRTDFQLGDNPLSHDQSPDETKEAVARFDEEFLEYIELAGKEVKDDENETVIKPTSPLLSSRDRLRPVEWRAVDDVEWTKRSLSPFFLIRAIQAEHHQTMQTYEDLQNDGYAYIYFFPEGYVEKAVIYVAPDDEEDKARWDQLTYTITTKPWEGLAEVEPGYREVDLKHDDKAR